MDLLDALAALMVPIACQGGRHSEVRPTAQADLERKTPFQETDPPPEIELIGTGTRGVAGRIARQETLLPGRDGFTGRDPDQTPMTNQMQWTMPWTVLVEAISIM